MPDPRAAIDVVRDALSEVYSPEGCDIWLRSPHRSFLDQVMLPYMRGDDGRTVYELYRDQALALPAADTGDDGSQ